MKPLEKEVLEDYLNAIDLLTINNNEQVLEKRVIELKEISKNNEYIIKSKLQEKDEQIQKLVEKQEKFELLLQSLIDSGAIKPKTNMI